VTSHPKPSFREPLRSRAFRSSRSPWKARP
jgi:hypothetical protein